MRAPIGHTLYTIHARKPHINTMNPLLAIIKYHKALALAAPRTSPSDIRDTANIREAPSELRRNTSDNIRDTSKEPAPRTSLSDVREALS